MRRAGPSGSRPRWPCGYSFGGPIRTFGAGADLRLMAENPLNAIFTLKGAVEQAEILWYFKKPVIFIGEGDVVAGWMEMAVCANFFLVTRHARIGAPEVKRGLTLPYGAPALSFRCGTSVARDLMASGEMISAEEAIRLGVADAMVPEGKDPTEHAFDLIRSSEFHDRIRQTAMLRQYGPPMRKLVQKSVSNYVKLLRSPETRRRIGSFIKEDV
jgi:enoyl-CoA hydratase/carnithine racemase